MITFNSVTKSYEGSGRAALDELSFEIEDGEFIFLIGPSGSGKSTFLQLMVRETNLTSGDIFYDDFHVNQLKGKEINRLRQSVGYVFQDFRLLPKLNVYDNVAFALEVIGKKKKEIAEAVPEVLDMVGLDSKAHRLPAELSGGEQQRVAIARAFVNKPNLVLADEPTGNLDPQTAQDIVTLLTRINDQGTTVIMSTHNVHTVNELRRRVLELDNGKLKRDEEHGIYGEAR